MTREEQLKIVIGVLIDAFGTEVSPTDNLHDLGTDSLDMCDFIMTIEEKIDKRIPDYGEEFDILLSGTVEEFNEWIYSNAE